MVDVSTFLLEQAQTSLTVQFVYDLASRRVVFVNAAYEWVLGQSRARTNEELPQLLARLHPDDRAYLAECWAQWQLGKWHNPIEFRLQTPGQPDQWLELTPSYLADSNGPGAVGGVLRDISVQKYYKAHADRFNARKNTLLEILSLDLSDALVLSQGLRHQAEAEQAYIQERLLEGLRHIEAISQEGAELVRNFTSEEAQTSVNVALNLERVELGDKLQQTIEDYARPEAYKAHVLDLQLPDYPVYLEMDVNKFLQVVTNLLGNAFKFTPDGGRLVIRLEVIRDVLVQLTFSDDGIGIPEAMLPHVFERFTPARRLGLRGEPTVGIDLSLCKHIVELHQGTLTVRSREGQGSTFIVTLPKQLS
ncbi:ATP-binding protein [Hymenobacter sp. GOD-10R]|uniref:PAS domain-containing sensor histidine kinase n=1 Tax=Hymenobacter sp. GOD-10R TaxID=3093922 RepID=UPI002D77B2C7|nr:ATP-binding protein [Hymenobacter sp. GOD-10R]WRQ30167.1 ATP-binding protein [Hymenobacter sp. GOD-10R]